MVKNNFDYFKLKRINIYKKKNENIKNLSGQCKGNILYKINNR
jgi:hypothetical protein